MLSIDINRLQCIDVDVDKPVVSWISSFLLGYCPIHFSLGLSFPGFDAVFLALDCHSSKSSR